MSKGSFSIKHREFLEEIERSLEEWDTLLIESIRNNDTMTVHKIKEHSSTLLKMRHIFMTRIKENKSYSQLINSIIQTIEKSRNYFQGYVIPRFAENFSIFANETNTCVRDLYILHKSLNEGDGIFKSKHKMNMNTIIPRMAGKGSLKPIHYNLECVNEEIQMKVQINNIELKNIKADLEFYVNLYAFESDQYLYENFTQKLLINKSGRLSLTNTLGVTLEANSKTYTINDSFNLIFKNLQTALFLQNIYLVFTIYVKDRFLIPMSEKEKEKYKKMVNPPYKHVFGYSFININDLIIQGKLAKNIENSFQTNIYFIKDYKEQRLKEVLIKNDTTGLEASGNSFYFDISWYDQSFDAFRENQRYETFYLLETKIEVIKKAFASYGKNSIRVITYNQSDFNNIDFEERKNEITLDIKMGDFAEFDSKKSQKNIEIVVNVIYNKQNLMNFIKYGSETVYTNEFRTPIFYHNNKPEFNESISVKIFDNIEDNSKLKVVFRVYHCSTTSKKKDRVLMSCAVLSLIQKQLIIKDGEMDLNCYNIPQNFDGNFYQILNYLETQKLKPKKDAIKVKLKFKAFNLSHNEIIHKIINWTPDQVDMVFPIVTKLMEMRDPEIIRFLKTIIINLMAFMSDKKYHLYPEVVINSCTALINSINYSLKISPEIEKQLKAFLEEELEIKNYPISRPLLKCIIFNLETVRPSLNLSGEVSSYDINFLKIIFKNIKTFFRLIKLSYKNELKESKDASLAEEFQSLLESYISLLIDFIDPHNISPLVDVSKLIIENSSIMLENLYDIVERKSIESFISQLSDIFLFFGRISKRLNEDFDEISEKNTANDGIDNSTPNKSARELVSSRTSEENGLNQNTKKLDKKQFIYMKMMFLMKITSLEFLYKEKFFMELFILLMEKYFSTRETNNEEYLFGLHFFEIIIANIHKSLLQENYELSTVNQERILKIFTEIFHRKPFNILTSDIVNNILEASVFKIMLTNFISVPSSVRMVLMTISMVIEDSTKSKFLLSFEQDKIHKQINLIFEIWEFIMKDKTLFHSEWIIMNFLLYKCMITWISLIKNLLLKNFLEGKSGESSEHAFLVKTRVIKISMTILQNPEIQTENFSGPKRKFWTEQCIKAFQKDDIRLILIDNILEIWKFLPDTMKYQIFSQAIRDIIILFDFKSKEISKFAIKIYCDLLHLEYDLSKGIRNIFSQTLEIINDLLDEKNQVKADNLMFTLSGMLETISETDSHVVKILTSTNFLANLAQYYGLSVKYYKSKHNEFKFPSVLFDLEIMALNDLINFVKILDQKKLLLAYLEEIQFLNEKLENFPEAAFSLLQRIKILKNNINDESAFPHFELNPQSPIDKYNFSFASVNSKEIRYYIIMGLYKLALEYSNQANAWEKSIKICEKMEVILNNHLFNFSELSSIVEWKSKFYNHIYNQKERMFFSYHKITLTGSEIPGCDTGKKAIEFIVRGKPLDNTSKITNGFKNVFSNLKPLKHNNTIEPEDGFIIFQIMNVTPATPKNLCDSGFKELAKIDSERYSQLPHILRQYYNNYHVKVFTSKKPIKQNKKAGNGVENLNIVKTFYITEEFFPGLKTYSRIINRKEIIISPLENAIDTIDEKNMDIIIKTHLVLESVRIIETKTIKSKDFQLYFSKKNDHVSQLGMILNGSLDAAVNGGIHIYRKAFLDSDYLSEHPDHENLMRALKKMIRELFEICDFSLDVYGKYCDVNMRPLFQYLKELSQKLSASYSIYWEKI